MSLQSFERSLARLEKVLSELHGEPEFSFVEQASEYTAWLSSYRREGINFNPEPTTFHAFLACVKRAEDWQRRNAYREALIASYEAIQRLASEELRAAPHNEGLQLPSAPHGMAS
ncbi:hypothetical protein [Caballeronia sp. S22]|uniref:hypothetical protein n=1 Tax=Caballeronia sp. S22 TaxID=3137182 RepID=UPI003530800D